MKERIPGLAELAELFKLPPRCTKAVITLEVGQLPMIELTRFVFTELGSKELKEISERYHLVPLDEKCLQQDKSS